MSAQQKTLFLTRDGGLQKHWAHAFGASSISNLNGIHPLDNINRLGLVVWIDLSTPNLPQWTDSAWSRVFQELQIKVVAASSSPNDEEGMSALDAGCAAYCHAYSDSRTLKRIQEVVLAGNIWVGRSLMNRLLRSTARIAAKVPGQSSDWSEGLTKRESEVASLASNGASNQLIASQCGITERTVKAHLSAVFEKLNVTDRLQLALRVHGIQ
jgi:DNA-binding NarL/FixJ family response regulator